MVDSIPPLVLQAARWLMLFTLALLLAGLSLNGTGLFDAGRTDAERIVQAVGFLPLICYCAAIGLVALAFGALGRSEAVEQIVARLLVRLGICLVAGGVLRVVGEPWLIRLIIDRPWHFANFDVAAIALATVGALMILLAGRLREAADMRAELDGIL